MTPESPTIIKSEVVDSTNLEAFRLLNRSNLAEGTVILANHQKTGRGQGKNHWESEPGKNLTCSIVFRPTFLSPTRQFLLTQIVSLGIRDGVSGLLPDPSQLFVKWPNDIYWQDRKISGTLIENKIQGNELMVSIAGIGINLNQEHFSSAAPLATSLKNISGKVFDIQAVFWLVYESIIKWYQILRDENYDLIHKTYLHHLLGFEETKRFFYEGEIFAGKITGIDPYGRIRIRKNNGQLFTFGFKEVTFLF